MIPRFLALTYGDVESGFIVVNCQIASFFLKRDEESLQFYITTKQEDNHNPFDGSEYFASLDAPNDDFMGWKGLGKIIYRVWMLLSVKSYGYYEYGILLKRVLGKMNTYTRVGVCKFSTIKGDHDNVLSSFYGVQPRTIIIE